MKLLPTCAAPWSWGYALAPQGCCCISVSKRSPCLMAKSLPLIVAPWLAIASPSRSPERPLQSEISISGKAEIMACSILRKSPSNVGPTKKRGGSGQARAGRAEGGFPRRSTSCSGSWIRMHLRAPKSECAGSHFLVDNLTRFLCLDDYSSPGADSHRLVLMKEKMLDDPQRIFRRY
jgi:hypothetical protein